LGTTIHLRVDPEVLTERLEKSKRRRPLLEVEDWEARLVELLEARKDLYARADLEVDVGELDVQSAAKRVFERLQEYEDADARTGHREAP
jgi:shikimate kinase